MASDDREKALELAFTQIEKQFGKGSIMKLGKAGALKGISVISTGSISLDSALGVGGVPRGRIVEIYGPEASGKTSLTLHIISEAQKIGGVAAFIDAEHALDPKYAQKPWSRARQPPPVATGYRRTNAGNRRSSDSKRSRGYNRN